MNFLVIIIAISLSMDAFSLCLAYGTLDLSNSDRKLLACVVGIYHFMMPLLGFFLGNKIVQLLPIGSNLIVFIVLFFIGIEMIVDTFKKRDEVKKMKILEMLTFGLAVSIDALSVGVSLNSICSNYLLAALTFSVTSFLFTYLGLFLGNKISKLIGSVSTLLGGITLIAIAIFYLV